MFVAWLQRRVMFLLLFVAGLTTNLGFSVASSAPRREAALSRILRRAVGQLDADSLWSHARALAADSMAYGGMAYGRDVVHCSIHGVAPTQENVRNGSYPPSRYLYLHTAGPLQGLVQEFVEWVVSKPG